jgi:hypothetical protein
LYNSEQGYHNENPHLKAMSSITDLTQLFQIIEQISELFNSLSGGKFFFKILS